MLGVSATPALSQDSSRTLAVNALVAGEIGYLFSSRRLAEPANVSLRDNPMIWGMVGLLLSLQLLLTYWPAMQQVFATAALPVFAWGWCLLVALGVCAGVEAEKWLLRRLQRPQEAR